MRPSPPPPPNQVKEGPPKRLVGCSCMGGGEFLGEPAKVRYQTNASLCTSERQSHKDKLVCHDFCYAIEILSLLWTVSNHTHRR